MRCEDFEVRLNEVLDERRPISSEPDLGEHIQDCVECRWLARSYEAVFAGLREAVIPAEPAWVSRRVLEEVRPRALLLTFRRAETLLTLAAALLLAVGLTWLVARPSRSVASSRLKQIDLPLAGHPAANRIAEKPALPNDGSPIDEQETTAEFLEYLPGSQWAQDVADGLQPVTEPTVGTITGFLRLWGVGDEGHRS